jgi:hypothetical protein
MTGDSGDRKTAVFLWDDALSTTSVGASLQGQPGLDVRGFSPEGVDLAAVDGDVVIISDLSRMAASATAPLFRQRPDLLFIGLDMATHQAVVVLGRQTQMDTTQDLLATIRSKVGASLP